jgi:phage terminase large subunit-like protein
MSRAGKSPEALFAHLLAMTSTERARILARLNAEEAAELYYDWSLWRRPDQQPPESDWIYWLILAGRGAGKTRAGAETTRAWARQYPIVNLIGATRQDAREIMVTGESGLLAICPPGERPTFARASDRLEWPNGAISQIFSAEEPDRLRGKQHMNLFR